MRHSSAFWTKGSLKYRKKVLPIKFLFKYNLEHSAKTKPVNISHKKLSMQHFRKIKMFLKFDKQTTGL